MLMILLLLSCFTVSSQDFAIRSGTIVKWSIGAGGNTTYLPERNIAVVQITAQSSLTGHFHSNTIHLQQGFLASINRQKILKSAPISNLIISPNPTTGRIVLRWMSKEIHENVNLTIFDLRSQIVDFQSIMRTGRYSVSVDLEDIPDGVYLIKAWGIKSGLGQGTLIVKR